jgi:hypothetical protein
MSESNVTDNEAYDMYTTTLVQIAAEIDQFLSIFKKQVQLEVTANIKTTRELNCYETDTRHSQKSMEMQWQIISTIIAIFAKTLSKSTIGSVTEHQNSIESLLKSLNVQHLPFSDYEYQLPFQSLKLLNSIKECIKKETSTTKHSNNTTYMNKTIQTARPESFSVSDKKRMFEEKMIPTAQPPSPSKIYRKPVKDKVSHINYESNKIKEPEPIPVILSKTANSETSTESLLSETYISIEELGTAKTMGDLYTAATPMNDCFKMDSPSGSADDIMDYYENCMDPVSVSNVSLSPKMVESSKSNNSIKAAFNQKGVSSEHIESGRSKHSIISAFNQKGVSESDVKKNNFIGEPQIFDKIALPTLPSGPISKSIEVL